MRRIFGWLLLASFTALVGPGCEPKLGGSCEKGDARCTDPSNLLVCQSGRYIATTCKGAKGCEMTGKVAKCDFSGNAAGDPCSTDFEGMADCASSSKLYTCRGGALVASDCKGPAGCKSDGKQATCDDSVAAVGDTCNPGTRACTADAKHLLACTGGKFAEQRPCRGRDGCSVKEGKLTCDLSVAAIDDPCTAEMSGNVACSVDGSQILVCKGQRFAIDEVCTGGKSCHPEKASIACEK